MQTKKTVIITGAAGGIGAAAARQFALKGYALVLTDIDPQKLNTLKEELSRDNYPVSTFPLDLEDEAGWNALIRFAIASYSRIDVLVNNAAWRVAGSLRTTTLADWEKTLRICLTAPVFLAKAAAAEMERQNEGGVIVNISSVMAERPSGLAPAYMAAKGAMNSLTKELAITYGRKGIRVIGVAPGYIDTDLSNDYVDPNGENISNRLISELNDYIPLGRGGKAKEIAQLITWVCSQEASYLTGTTILADGGFQSNFNSYTVKNLQYPEEF